jgi:hypothetical protein
MTSTFVMETEIVSEMAYNTILTWLIEQEYLIT